MALSALSLTGYRFGTGDHVTQFPSVLHFFNPQLYQKDLPLQMIFPPYLKVGLHVVLFSLARFLHLPVEYVYLFVHLGVFVAFFWVSQRLLGLLRVSPRGVFWGLVGLVLWAVYAPSVSHFQILVSHLVPYQFVLPLALGAFYLFLRERLWSASLLLGLSFLVHQQIGLLFFVSLLAGLVLEALFFDLRYLKGLVPLSLPFSLVFSSYFVFLQTRGSHQGYPWFDATWGEELLRMVKFRVPHHLLLSYAKPWEIGFVLLLALLVLLVLKKEALRAENRPLRRICFVCLALLGLLGVGSFFSEVYPLPVALGLYPLRSDVLLRVLSFFLLVYLLDRKFPRPRFLPWPPSPRLWMLWGVLLVLFFFLGPHVRPFLPPKQVVRLCKCVQEKTPQRALILAPPALKGVRLYCERSVWVSWKAHGLFFSPSVAREWFRRVLLLCQLDEDSACEGRACLALCRKNFSALSEKFLWGLSKGQDIDYLLLEKGKIKGSRPLCETEDLALYEVRP